MVVLSKKQYQKLIGKLDKMATSEEENTRLLTTLLTKMDAIATTFAGSLGSLNTTLAKMSSDLTAATLQPVVTITVPNDDLDEPVPTTTIPPVAPPPPATPPDPGTPPTTPTTPATGSFPEFTNWDTHTTYIKAQIISNVTSDLAAGIFSESSSMYYAPFAGLESFGDQDTLANQALTVFLTKYYNLSLGARQRWLFTERIIALNPALTTQLTTLVESEGFRYGFSPDVIREIVDQDQQREIAYACIGFFTAIADIGYTITPASATFPTPFSDGNISVSFERLVLALKGCLSKWSGIDTDFFYTYRTSEDRNAATTYRKVWETNRIWKPFMAGLLLRAACLGIERGYLDEAQTINWCQGMVTVIRRAWTGTYFRYTHYMDGTDTGEDLSNHAKLNGLIYPGLLWLAKETEDAELYTFAADVFEAVRAKFAADVIAENFPTKKEVSQDCFYRHWTQSLFTA